MQPTDRPTPEVLETQSDRQPAARAGSPRARRLALSIAIGGGLALGVAGLAQAADVPKPSGSAQPSSEAGPGAGRGESRSRQPHLAGTVKSITADRIVIVDRDGFTRQINITETPDGVKVGTVIFAVGKVNADGVSLDATEVKVAPERPAGAEGRRGGPGGPGGHRGGGDKPAGPGKSAAPSGSAAPSASASAGS